MESLDPGRSIRITESPQSNSKKNGCVQNLFHYLQTFDKSQPPARFGVIGLAIGFSTFGFLTTIICLLWFCCIRNKEDYRYMEEEEEEEKPKQMFMPTSDKPHGIAYIAQQYNEPKSLLQPQIVVSETMESETEKIISQRPYLCRLFMTIYTK